LQKHKKSKQRKFLFDEKHANAQLHRIVKQIQEYSILHQTLKNKTGKYFYKNIVIKI